MQYQEIGITNQTETEFKLVLPGDGISVRDELLNVPLFSGYRFGHATAIDIHDTYYDHPVYTLRKNGIALRVRKQNGIELIAVKSGEMTTDDGLSRRFEWEQQWGKESVYELAQVLENAGVKTDKTIPEVLTGPRQYLKQAGYRIIQERQTCRFTRMVDGAGVSMELAIDRTVYNTRLCEVEHNEIELEISDAEVREAASLVSELHIVYPQLFPWPHNKLATGLALDSYSGLEKLCHGQSICTLNKSDYEGLHRYMLET